MQVLNMQENLLAHHDVQVLQHFVELGLTAKDYVWPLLSSMFSDVFAEAEWLRVWDNIVSNHPGYLMYVALAYLVLSRVSPPHVVKQRHRARVVLRALAAFCQ